ncbi:MAG: hypothetical protein H3C47_06650 [Candidatus Cloacimonetes bacterium]|nr:hypothetical protein [Candidatus Cloacimonadota bacterium]
MIAATVKSRVNEDICVLACPDNHGYSYMFDCGMASMLTVGDVMKLKALFVTHTHIDHFANFDFVIRNRAGSREPVIICGPPGISTNVESRLNSYTWNLIGKRRSYFEVREILDSDTIEVYRLSPPLWKKTLISTQKCSFVFENEQITVSFCILDHKIPSIAYRMAEKNTVKIHELPYAPGPWVARLKEAYLAHDKSRAIETPSGTVMAGDLFCTLREQPGYSLGFAMDHLGGGQNHKLLVSFFKNLDELFIESFFRQVDLDYAIRHHHSTSYLSGCLAREAGVKKLNLVHHSRRYLGEVADVIEEGMAAFEGREPQFLRTPVSRYFEVQSDSELDEV